MAQISTTANIAIYNGLKFSQDGKPRISFRAAETARIKDQSGQWVDGGTTWYNVTLFGGAAEALARPSPRAEGGAARREANSGARRGSRVPFPGCSHPT